MENLIKLHGYLFWYLLLIPTLTIAIPVDTITPTQPLTENQTLVSAGDLFELGFFRPDNSGKLYVGIWYKRISVKTIVWVANRDKPVRNSSGILEIGEDGNIQLVDTTGNPMWSSSNQSTARNTVAQLLDSGNFVLRQENDENPGNYLWQSFDYPTDTLLPGMKLGWDAKTGRNRYVSSWKSSTDPSEGDYTFKLDINGSSPEAYLRNRDKIIHRSGAWNGVRFSGAPGIGTEGFIASSFVKTKQEIYYTFEIQNRTLYSRLLVNHTGYLERSTWIEANRIWNVFWFGPRDQCDYYKECGTFAICDTNDSPVCECLVGFKPRNQQAWDLRDGSEGCFRYHELVCETDGFLTLEYMKLPETTTAAFVDAAMSLDECKEMCVRDCFCTAYTNSNISGGGSGCIIWTAELVDMRRFSAGSGQPFYVRVAASDADKNGDVATTGDGDSGKTKKIILGCGITLGIVLFLLFVFFQLKRRKSVRVNNRRTTEFRGERGGDHLMNAIAISNKRELSGETITTDEFELPVFDLSTIVMATDNFANANKLGQGGFGSVYKGILVGGEEIAVKRLSKNSGQGVEEFKNELRLIARLQHRNLVRLLGCCVDNEEKMLVYEYMENKSLDSILFNKHKSSLLDWKTRFNIICGIARGLLYLHQDSRFRIIHRDLKASNILLDKEMNPKISDFGMARIFGGDETEANNTIRVVGTYGYMSPEYAMDGLFSVKSDVFSFGVLVLEIVTGKHNRGFYKQNNEENLLGLAWRLWRERRGLELRDSTMISEAYSEWDDQVMRSIQVGLLCVQEKAEDRPNMATVMFMLSSEGALLPQPKQPGFCLGNNAAITNSSSSNHNHQTLSLNQLTVTALHGR
ncbi:PREDICTED: receptor-like serine/threonine-protein kinase SD1-8 [Ipomoea nil]|uniref:receptor-like serine/threonine-protein kinase SD1-8 n=1 Tax=Ipomoea nil TaxID=35883 RepID=UPI0009011E06|nr:PREDICTED: receptor-like serine/threonine-protein kinase SD1-8 [Ipomoea nil]